MYCIFFMNGHLGEIFFLIGLLILYFKNWVSRSKKKNEKKTSVQTLGEWSNL